MPPLAQPSGDDIDKLFSSERLQFNLNAGLATWEISLLAENLVNGWPGGHRPNTDQVPLEILDNGYGVHIDEAKWHPVFWRGKWFDFHRPILDPQYFPNGSAGITLADIWSVDNPVVWKELSFSLELANRWLHQMAKGDWLNQMFNEPRLEWTEAQPTHTQLVEPEFLGPNQKPWKIPGLATKYNGNITLYDIHRVLGPKLVWTFFDEDNGMCNQQKGKRRGGQNSLTLLVRA